MTWSRRAITTIVLASGLAVFATGVANAYSSLVSVTWGSWTQYSQQDSNWCWAAGAKMFIQKLKGSSPTECAEVNYAKGTTTCADLTGTQNDVYNILHHWGVNSSPSYTGAPGFATIRNETVAGGGVLTRVVWQSGGSVGHQAPLIGSTSSGQVYITFIREGAVSGSWITYAQFLAGTAGLGSPYTPANYIQTWLS